MRIEDVDRLRVEIESVRRDLGKNIAELDRRRHSLAGTLKRAGEAAAILGALAAGVFLARLVVPPRRRARRFLLG